tara:strand:+ start:152 stop:517 length:366 start_codon:yes stop_codon:yes gene_type:complete
MEELTDRQLLLIDDTEKYLSSCISANLIKDLTNMDKAHVNQVLLNIVYLYEEVKVDLEKATEYEEDIRKVCDDHLVGCNPEQIDELLRVSEERHHMLEEELEEKENTIGNLESEIYNNNND